MNKISGKETISTLKHMEGDKAETRDGKRQRDESGEKAPEKVQQSTGGNEAQAGASAPKKIRTRRSKVTIFDPKNMFSSISKHRAQFQANRSTEKVNETQSIDIILPKF